MDAITSVISVPPAEVLAIIPARVGSQGIPLKNFRLLDGVSPLDRTIACALMASCCPVVTTDSEETVAGTHWRYAGPPIHTNACSMVDVVNDVLSVYRGEPTQRILVLQPTQPLRRPSHLRQALALLAQYPSVASVVEVEPAAKLYYEGFVPVLPDEPVEQRQHAQPTYACDGTVYGFLREWFQTHQTFRHAAGTAMLIIPRDQTCRLDTLADWRLAERILRAPEY